MGQVYAVMKQEELGYIVKELYIVADEDLCIPEEGDHLSRTSVCIQQNDF